MAKNVKYIHLRAHHMRSLDRIVDMNPVRVFISNFLWYGWKESVYRYKLLRDVRNADEVNVTIAESTADQICMNCRHKAYCATGIVDLRKKRMAFYETILLKGKFHDPIAADRKAQSDWN